MDYKAAHLLSLYLLSFVIARDFKPEIHLYLKIHLRIEKAHTEMNIEKLQNIGTSKIEMAFQRMGDHSRPMVVLIMGAGAQMISWPDEFCERMISKGIQILRFDNRDTGLSSHLHDAPEPDFIGAMKGDFSSASYSLSDMAADVIGLIDALELDKVHLVGASMGGMIAQTIAIEYPSRVKSLTSIMSTTGSPLVGQPDYPALSNLGEPPYTDKQAYVDWRVRSLKAIGSPVYEFDETSSRKIAAISWDRDHDANSIIRQSIAVLKSGDRTSKLRELNVPALVIHGDADKMIHVSGGVATASAIPGAKLKVFEGMGHGFPKELWSEMIDLFVEHVNLSE